MRWTWWVGLVGAAFGDDDGWEEEEHHRADARSAGPSVAPVADPAWRSECGSCHFAYPPGLLPARSWTVLLSDLPHHFGDDAAVAEPTLAHLKAVAAAGAADAVREPLSVRLALAARGTTPTRVSEIPWLRAEHREEVPASLVTGNPKVKSWAACAACHPDAAAGSFAESRVAIPR